jgi:starvation-inducible DNA-binding protein
MKKILSILLLATFAINCQKNPITQTPCDDNNNNNNNILHKTTIAGLNQETRKEIINILNQSLADVTDLAANLKQAHWNIKGPQFIAIHEMLDKLATNTNAHIDIIAERVTSLGGTALGTIRQASRASKLDAYPLDIFTTDEHLKTLAKNHADLGKTSRENIKITEDLDDMVTSDLYIELSNLLDKNLWFIEAHLQK